MSRIARRVCIVWLALLLALCVGEVFELRAAPSAGDKTLVPGERAGPLYLGMNAADVYRLLGEPTGSVEYTNKNGKRVRFDWPDYSVLMQLPDQAVIEIQIRTPSYSTRDGLHVGSSVLELRAKYGEPAWARPGVGDSMSYCFDVGLFAGADHGKINTLTVETRGC